MNQTIQLLLINLLDLQNPIYNNKYSDLALQKTLLTEITKFDNDVTNRIIRKYFVSYKYTTSIGNESNQNNLIIELFEDELEISKILDKIMEADKFCRSPKLISISSL